MAEAVATAQSGRTKLSRWVEAVPSVRRATFVRPQTSPCSPSRQPPWLDALVAAVHRWESATRQPAPAWMSLPRLVDLHPRPTGPRHRRRGRILCGILPVDRAPTAADSLAEFFAAARADDARIRAAGRESVRLAAVPSPFAVPSSRLSAVNVACT
jgi:hypothetical protein